MSLPLLGCPPNLVIPTGGRNLLVAGSVALQTTADSSTATPFRNDKKGENYSASIRTQGSTAMVPLGPTTSAPPSAKALTALKAKPCFFFPLMRRGSFGGRKSKIKS